MHPNAAFVGNSSEAVAAIFRLHNDCKTVLDPTYGRGAFYRLVPELLVTGGDIDPAKGVPMDMRALPFGDSSFDAVVIDPPYLGGSAGRGSALEQKYGIFSHSQLELLSLYSAGLTEAWRVARKLVVAKCADAVDSGRFVPVAARLIAAFPHPLYDMLITVRQHSLQHPFWKTVQHFRHNYAYYLLWRKEVLHVQHVVV